MTRAEQDALYAAEEQALDEIGIRWERLRDVRRYLNGLVDSEWFFERWPHFVRCEVERRGRGATWSTCHRLDAAGPDGQATEGVLLLVPGAIRQSVVLHELAHLLCPPEVGHGPRFADVLLTLVRHEMGFNAYADLHAALARSPAFASVAGT